MSFDQQRKHQEEWGQQDDAGACQHDVHKALDARADSHNQQVAYPKNRDRSHEEDIRRIGQTVHGAPQRVHGDVAPQTGAHQLGTVLKWRHKQHGAGTIPVDGLQHSFRRPGADRHCAIRQQAQPQVPLNCLLRQPVQVRAVAHEQRRNQPLATHVPAPPHRAR